MKRSAADVERGNESAEGLPCPRCAAVALLFLVSAIVLGISLVPVKVDVRYTFDVEDPANFLGALDVNLYKSEAVANPVVTTYGRQLLSLYADSAGLTEGQFVATVAGAITASTGMILAREQGIQMGASAEANLQNLVETADYPDWDDLSEESQATYVSRDNYNAVKFNQLMNLFGFEDTNDGFYGSNGSAFDMSEENVRKLQQLGRIGKTWQKRVGYELTDIKNMLLGSAPGELYLWLTGQQASGEMTFDGTGYEAWPQNWPRKIYLIEGTKAWVTHGYGASSFRYFKWATSKPIYLFLMQGENRKSQIVCALFSEEPFKFGSGQFLSETDWPNPDTYPEYVETEYGNFYMKVSTVGLPRDTINGYPTINIVPTGTQIPSNDVLATILFGDVDAGGLTPDLPGYEPEADLPVYFPSEGLVPGNVFYDFTGNQRPDNPYNPDNQSGQSEWKQETEQNIQPLLNVNVDKLFPFCLLYDIGLLHEKMVSLGVFPSQNVSSNELETQDAEIASEYLYIRMPIKTEFINGVEDEELTIDLSPLHDLLLLVQPATQVLLVIGLLFSVIMFWKGVITG